LFLFKLLSFINWIVSHFLKTRWHHKIKFLSFLFFNLI
jgi:hypothetical protein